MNTFSDLTREQIHHMRDLWVRTGTVALLDVNGIHVNVPDEGVSGPHDFIGSSPQPNDVCAVLDSAEGDRLVVVLGARPTLAAPVYTLATLPSVDDFMDGEMVGVEDAATGEQVRMALNSGWINLG